MDCTWFTRKLSQKYWGYTITTLKFVSEILEKKIYDARSLLMETLSSTSSKNKKINQENQKNQKPEINLKISIKSENQIKIR